MAKQLNVNLGFTADTSQAAAQLQQLQKQLQDLVLTGGQKASPLGLTKELMQATEKAAELKIALEGATNPKTGMLDLSKFNANLQKSNTSIQEYAQHLYNLGPAGQQAFSQLASSINQAEIPLKRSSKMLTEFATTLKNTARWQISSSILHGFMGTVQSAWRYAQNLNASLNDIRIVTGANVDEMAQFAEQANRSAKALSTTTNEYAKASLIYYQQGLDASQAQERTDITIKMANASGQSAETVSDQMTAVWNNFAKGGDDLERFADVMVRLGADTASSSDEIAQGLEKFASIGDMVGLSFDNAAAALATVTATTRQSADIVGTAFKTIFARIQGLKLGETLEDGTDLNKYSEALATVGISIKEQNGELKDMDTILAEMGAKWQTLSKDQQVALAQTVAGARQYNQLVALMDNFDFYEQNLERAKNADGSLQKQADIYAESWEAASKRVTAAAEDIYDSLLKDNVFIKLTDGVAGFLNIIGDTIDGIGGMKGALALLGVVITRVFSQDIANSLERFAYNIKSFTKKGRENLFNEQLKTKQNTNQALRDFQNDGTITGSTRADVNKAQADIQDQMALRAKSLLDSGRQLSEVEQKKMQIMSDQVRILGEQATQAASLREQSEKTTGSLERQLSIRMAQATGGQNTQEYGNFKTQIKEAKELQTQFGIGNTMLQKFQSLLKGTSDKGKTLKNITQYFEEFIGKANSAGVEVGELQNILNKLKNMKINGADTFINAFETELVDLGGRAEQVFMDIQTEAHRLADAGKMNPQQLLTFIQTLDQLQREFTETGTFTEQQIAALRDLGIQVTQTGEVIRGFTGRIPTMAEGIVAFGNTLSSLTMAFTSLQGLISTWNNQDATFGEKLITTFTTLGMVIPIVTTAFQQQNLAQMATLSSAIASILPINTLSASEIAAGLAGEAGAAGAVSFGAALWALLWPIGAVITVIAILAGGIYLLFQAFTAENRAAKENAEAMAKQNEETQKLVEETNTLNNEAENLIDTFNKQKAAGEDVTETYEKLSEKLDAVRENYEQLNVSQATLDLLTQAEALGIATGNWEDYYKAIAQAQEEANRYAGKIAKANVNSNLKGAEAAFTDGDGDKSNGYLRRTIGSVGTDQKVGEILSEYSDIVSDISGDDGVLKIDVSSPGKFLQDYQRLGAIITDLEVAGKTSNDTYRELKVEFDAMADYAAEIKNSLGDAAEYDLVGKMEDKGITPENITSINDYNSVVNTLSESIKGYYSTTEEAKSAVERFLSSYDNIQGMQQSLDFLEKYERKLKDLKDLKEEQTTTTQVSAPTWDANGNIVAGTENNKTEVVQTKFVPVYEQAEVNQKVQEMQAYIEGLTQEEKITLGQLDLSKVDITNIDSIKAKIEEKLSETVRAQAKIELQTEVEEFELDPGLIEDVTDAFIDMAEAGEEGYEILGKDAEAAKDAAIRFGRLQNAVLDLSENLDDYKDVLKDVVGAQSDIDKAVVENSEGFKSFKKSIAGLIGTSEDLVDVDFVKLIDPKDLEAAAAGNEAAIDRIREAFIRAQIEAANLNDISLSDIQNELNRFADGQVFDIDTTPFLNKLIAAQLAAGATAADIEAMLSGFGIDADVTPIMSDFDQVAAAAAGTADAVIANTSFEAEVTPEEITQESTAIEQAFEETVTQQTHSSTGDQVLQTGGDGGDVVPIRQQVTSFNKSVKATPVEAKESKTTTASSINMKNAAGKNAGIQGVKISNAHKTVQAAKTVAPSTQNAAGKNLSDGGKGGKGGGGGGGGSNKAKKPTKAKTVEPTEKKEKEDEIERYKEITEILDDLNNELDEIGKLKDEAWGPNKLKAMDQEIAKLKQLSKAQQQYSNEIQSKLAGDKAAVAALGGTFDEFGRLTNYEQLMGGLVDTWNSTQAALDSREQAYENSVAAVANTEYAEGQESQQWAAEDANDAEKEAIDRARDSANKAYEDNKKAIEQYIETLNLSEEAKRQLDDYLRQIKELNYEKLMYKIEFRVEVNERELKILDHYIGRIEDDFYKIAEVMAKIYNDTGEAYKSQFYENDALQTLNTGINELEQALKNAEITQADYIEGLGKIQDMAMDNVDALYEMNSQMREYYADVIDEGISKIQEMTDHFDHLTSKLQHYSNILSLMGHEQNYDLQNNLLQGQIDVLNDRIETSKATIAMLDSSLKSAQTNYENATSEEDKEYWKERIIQINQALSEEEDAYLSYVEEVGDAANQILANSIEKAFKEAELSMTNDLGFDSILADMERMNTLTDEFLTNTNKMYETNKMISSAQLAIDKTQNAQAKQKYQDYIKYIEQLQVSGNLTQTELQTAQARYKVLEAEIALEEAKNAKSEVRLTRDSEGNFGYVYTANQDEVASATQNYLDAQNELYNIGLENSKEYREKTIQLQQSTLEELKQLEIDFRIDHIISEEQYNQQKAAILETSNALLETYNEQFQIAQFTMATTSYNALMTEDTNFYNSQLSRNREHTSLMLANDTEYYNGIQTIATETQNTLETNLANFNAGVLSSEDANYIVREARDRGYYDSLNRIAFATSKEIKGIFNDNNDSLSKALQITFYNNLNTALNNCEGATRDWESRMSPLINAVGVSFNGKDIGLSAQIAATLKESQNLKDYITKKPDGLIDGIDREWWEVETATMKWTEHWQNIQNNVIPAYDALIQRTQQLIQAEAGSIANEPQYPEDPYADFGDSGYDYSDGGSNAIEAQASILASQAMEIVQKVHYNDIQQDSSGWRNNAKAAGYSDEAIALALRAFNDSKAGGGYSYYYDKALELVQSYDTGGYTGDWGPEGKLAVLHEKELVLNAQDTENFLTATTMLHEISQMLDNNALLASLGMINLSAMTLNTEADKILQQDVTIHADFPNVTDHNEIEMAIDNLINAASQYANRK